MNLLNKKKEKMVIVEIVKVVQKNTMKKIFKN